MTFLTNHAPAAGLVVAALALFAHGAAAKPAPSLAAPDPLVGVAPGSVLISCGPLEFAFRNLFCLSKKDDGSTCSGNQECKSGSCRGRRHADGTLWEADYLPWIKGRTCKRAVEDECTIGLSLANPEPVDCNPDEYCRGYSGYIIRDDKYVALHNRCFPKKDAGVMCSDDKECLSGSCLQHAGGGASRCEAPTPETSKRWTKKYSLRFGYYCDPEGQQANDDAECQKKYHSSSARATASPPDCEVECGFVGSMGGVDPVLGKL